MKKSLFILCLLLLNLKVYSQFNDINPLENINITVADDSDQDVGDPYKIIFSFDLIAANVEAGIGQDAYAPAGWYVFMKKSTDGTPFPSWPIAGSNKFSGNNNPNFIEYSTSTIAGGFRFKSEPIQIKDFYPQYPSGTYEFVIIGYRGGNSWTFVGGSAQSYLSDNTQTFTLSDICATCPPLYEGDDNDGDGILELYDNCPNTFNPDQLDSDNDNVGDVCDNCLTISNTNQADLDNDGIGDVCDNDRDGDGVNNQDDGCPSVSGNISNFGCPGNPDLMIDDEFTLQYSDCYSCNGALEDVSNSNRPKIYRYGGNITFNPLVIRNIGDGIGYASPKIRFYLSSDNVLSDDDIGFGQRTFSISPPAPGESTPTQSTNSGRYAVSIEGSDIGNQVSYGNYYLIIIIDEENDLGGSDLNLDNNSYVLPITYTGSNNSRSFYLDIGDGLISVPLENTNSLSNTSRQILPVFNLKVYNLYFPGFPLINQDVNDGQILDLTNFGSGTYVVHVNDNYVKKFKKFRILSSIRK